MAYTNGVDVRDGSYQLIGVEFNQQRWHHLFHLHVLLHHSVESVRDKVHHHVEVDLLGLFAVSIEELTHFDTVRVMKSLQNLELTVLIALVLKHLFNSNSLAGFSDGRLEHDAEGAVSHNFLRVVSETLNAKLSLVGRLPKAWIKSDATLVFAVVVI